MICEMANSNSLFLIAQNGQFNNNHLFCQMFPANCHLAYNLLHAQTRKHQGKRKGPDLDHLQGSLYIYKDKFTHKDKLMVRAESFI